MHSFTKHRTQLLLIVILFITFVQNSYAANDSAFVHEVFNRLITVAYYSDELAWPPKIEIKDDTLINAYARGIDFDDSDRLITRVQITKGMLHTIIQNEPDRLAAVLGHELAHIVLGHIERKRGKTKFLEVIISRENELSADKTGLQIALAAGYSFQKAISLMKKFIELGKDYSSLTALKVKHPSWKERLEQVDKEQATLWSAMSAFENGNTFLFAQQYSSAERCFKKVTEEFPSCYEAWTNLGYALLMQYCDALNVDDIKQLNIGHLMTGGFYRRPETLEKQVRGVDEEQWWDAVGALREAIRLKPDLALAKANLGIAYLVHPNGKDVGQATKFFTDAIKLAEQDTTMNLFAKASIYINAGVGEIASGQTDQPEEKFKKANAYIMEYIGEPVSDTMPSYSDEINYNRAEMLSRSSVQSEKLKALQLFETYLQEASESSLWWQIAYQQYIALCTTQRITAKPIDELQQNSINDLRPIISIDFGKKEYVTLLESTNEVKKRLGEAVISIPVIDRTNLLSLSYPQYGIRLLANEKILAITLQGEFAPKIKLKMYGLTRDEKRLSLGMTRETLENILQNIKYDFRQIMNPNAKYRYYSKIGLGVLIRNNKVTEFVIAQVPRKKTKQEKH